jgi:translocation and assembly module TamB
MADARPAKPRRSRSRQAARWLLILLALGALLVASTAVWLLRSGGGRDFALARVTSALPPGSLAWRSAEGTISGPLTLHGVRYEHDGVIVEVERAVIDIAPTEMLDRRVHIESLLLERGRVQLPPGEESTEPWPRSFALPDALPAIELPVAVRLDQLQIEGVAIEQGEVSLLQLHRLDAIGSFEQGRIALQKLDIDSDRGSLRSHGDLDTAKLWDTGLDATLSLAGLGEQPLPLTIAIDGDLKNLTLNVRADVSQPATLDLTLTGGLPNPAWTMTLDAPSLDPAAFGAEGEPMTIALQGSGALREANIAGRFAQGTNEIRIEPSTLRYDDGVLKLDPFAIDLQPGRVSATGEVDLRETDPLVALDVVWADVQAPSEDGSVVVTSAGSARVEGRLDDYALMAKGSLQRAAETAQIELAGRGTSERLQFESLSMRTPRGAMQAKGSVAWAPHLRWQIDATLDDFDPGFLAPDFPGAVDAGLVSEGSLIDGKPQGSLRLDPLGGELRGRKLGGRFDASLAADGSGSATFALAIGESNIEGDGRWSETIDARLRVAPLNLADVLPDAAGELRGNIALSGPRDTPAIEADLDGSAISLDGFAAESLHLRGRIEQFANGTLSLEAQQVELGGQNFGTLTLSGEGSRAQHEINFALGEGVADLALTLAGGELDDQWNGQVHALRIEPRERAAWTLRAPASLAIDRADRSIVLGDACLVEKSASLCIDADWQAQAGRAQFVLENFEVATLDPFLADALGQPVSAYGTLAATGNLQRDAGGALTGSLEVRSPQAGLRLDPQSERELLALRNLQIDGALTSAEFTLRANAALAGDGSLLADLRSSDPTAADGALSGRVEARVRDLTFIELFSDQLVDPVGTLDGDLAIAGTRNAPSLSGSAKLAGFGGELPALGLTLSEGEITLQSRGAQAADIRGQVRSGQGVLQVEGSLDAGAQAEERLALTLKGENVTAIGTPEATAAISPDLTLSLRGDRLRLRGKVEVPLARIELERLQSTTSSSPDAVIVDADEVADEGGIALDSDVTVVIGDDVKLNGFGLKGKLSGQFSVRDRPGRATVGRGGIEVTGEYKAYGQDLEITRGRLAYASTPIDNPSLDIRAQREIDEITVGVQVRGTALAPELTLWSDPSLDQAEQLSYLVLGRPLRSASQADGAQLSQAAAAIGGNLLAKRLGARMGLDEVGVADSRALGGAALTVGKYLSPKLYVSYGVALFGTGQVVTFKYLLSRVWSVQIDSGTENRAAVNYRLER